VVGFLLIAGLALVSVGAPVAGTPVAAAPVPDPAAAESVLPEELPAAPSAPSTAPEPSPQERLELLRSALLRPSEVGPNWKLSPTQPSPDAAAPAPCGGSGVVARFPDAQRIGTALQSAADERMQQTLSVFADTKTAGSAFDAYSDGLSCRSGALGSTPVTISAPEDVQSRVRGDRATSWTLSGQGFKAVLVSVVAEDQLVNFVFLTPTGGKLTRLDALSLARTGVARLLAT
jgi:hypothetical protein